MYLYGSIFYVTYIFRSGFSVEWKRFMRQAPHEFQFVLNFITSNIHLTLFLISFDKNHD